MPEYAIILFVFFLLASLLHMHYRLRLYRSWKQFWITNSIIFVFATIWDHYAAWRGHWVWGERFLFGPRIGLLPIEEYGFIAVVTYFVIVFYRFVEKKYAR